MSSDLAVLIYADHYYTAIKQNTFRISSKVQLGKFN